MSDHYKEIRDILRNLRFYKLTDLYYYNHVISILDLLPLKYSYVLKEHYLKCRRLWTIAYESFYSTRSIERFHHDGIVRLEFYYDLLKK